MRPLPLIVIAQLFGTSLWFSANSATDDLIRSWGIAPADIGTLTNAVQFGFILGTLGFAISGLADRFPASRIFAICALLGALWAQHQLKIPAIGGKDSMSGTFEHIHVPPTLAAFAVDVPGRKWQQIDAFAQCLTFQTPPTHWLDWCAGKGHLGRRLLSSGQRLTCLEYDPALIESGQLLSERHRLDARHVQQDVLTAEAAPKKNAPEMRRMAISRSPVRLGA